MSDLDVKVRLEQRKKGTSTWALLATKYSSSTGAVSAAFGIASLVWSFARLFLPPERPVGPGAPPAPV